MEAGIASLISSGVRNDWSLPLKISFLNLLEFKKTSRMDIRELLLSCLQMFCLMDGPAQLSVTLLRVLSARPHFLIVCVVPAGVTFAPAALRPSYASQDPSTTCRHFLAKKRGGGIGREHFLRTFSELWRTSSLHIFLHYWLIFAAVNFIIKRGQPF